MATYNSFKRITSEAIVDGEIVASEIASATVTQDDIADGAVTEAKILDGAVTSGKLSSTLDISGKTVTYRPINGNDISASAGVAGSKFAGGAMASNLGGAPLNKTGGTMTGSLNVGNGSGNSPAIYRTADTNTGIYFTGNASQNLDTVLVAGGQEGLRVNATNGGRLTKPNSVAFTASGTSGWRYANSYGGIRWRSLNSNFGWSATQQRGGTNFNTSNGRFTAPVAGFYQFHFETYARNDRNNNQGYYHMSFGINGGNQMVGGRTPHGIFAHSNVSRYYPNGTHMDLGTYLNAGQYVEVRVYWHNNQTRFHGAHSCFNGYMIT